MCAIEGTRSGREKRAGSSCNIISKNTTPNRNSSTCSLSRNISGLSPGKRAELFDLTSPRAVTDELARIQSVECFLEHLVAIVCNSGDSLNSFISFFLVTRQRSRKIVGILSRLVARYWTSVIIVLAKDLNPLWKKQCYFCITKRKARRSMCQMSTAAKTKLARDFVFVLLMRGNQIRSI